MQPPNRVHVAETVPSAGNNCDLDECRNEQQVASCPSLQPISSSIGIATVEIGYPVRKLNPRAAWMGG
jgi:hypothetical protein